jgi:cob(I)alamin adenosyltransferase
MTKTASISTKTGDAGQTSLANGERVDKNGLVMELVGTLDEVNSWLGLVIVHAESDFFTHRGVLEQIQHDLYQLSAVIVKAPKIKFSKASLQQLEKQALALEKKMKGEWQGKFVYPGGTKLAAMLDITRTVCRRCERVYFSYTQKNEQNSVISSYLNRLSDYLFLLRCYVNLSQKHAEKTLSPDK